jgi:hypothetical protein
VGLGETNLHQAGTAKAPASRGAGRARGHPPVSHGAAAKPYPLTKCLVTDEAFEHGKPYVFVHEGQEISMKASLVSYFPNIIGQCPLRILSKVYTP